jgi:3-hydroxyisobutyrate dehydrogenase
VERTGVIGLGQMGEGIAVNLAKAGFPLTVFDVRPEPLARMAALGATAAPSCVEVGRHADVVHVVVFDDDQTRAVCLGAGDDGGVVAGLEPGAVVLLHSTISPRTCREVAAAAAAQGVTVIDAAMTGGSGVAAMAGELTLMIGGDAATVERCRPMLDAITLNYFHVGPLGLGVTAKILNNLVCDMYVDVVRNALRLAALAGIDEDVMLRIFNEGRTAASSTTANWSGIRDMEATHPLGTQGLVEMTKKDLRLALELADDVGCRLPTVEVVVRDVLPTLNNGLTRLPT